MGRKLGSGKGLPRWTPFPIEERTNAFWAQVQKGSQDDCWLWRGAVGNHGYGTFSFDGKTVTAHRFAYFLEYGKWPMPCCCHRCDVRRCCNPAHLFEGTYRDNNDDMTAKGRANRVGFNPILTEAIVLAIRGDYKFHTVSEMAEKFNLPKTQIFSALYKWKHLPPLANRRGRGCGPIR